MKKKNMNWKTPWKEKLIKKFFAFRSCEEDCIATLRSSIVKCLEKRGIAKAKIVEKG